jgi:hypothetical protein
MVYSTERGHNQFTVHPSLFTNRYALSAWRFAAKSTTLPTLLLSL